MSQTFEAIFDGSVLRPEQPIELEPNTRVRITIEPVTTSGKQPESFLEVARSLSLEGPHDWSSRLDESVSLCFCELDPPAAAVKLRALFDD